MKKYSLFSSLVILLLCSFGSIVKADVTFSHDLSNSVGTSYQNASSSTKWVNSVVYESVATGDTEFDAYVGAGNPPLSQVARCYSVFGLASCTLSYVVPSGYYYEVKDVQTHPLVIQWAEWNDIPNITYSTTTNSVINNPNQDTFDALIVFFIAMFGTLWIFRRLK